MPTRPYLDLRNLLTKTGQKFFRPECLIPVTMITALCGVIGPFKTFEVDPLWFRLVYWGGVVIISTYLAMFFLIVGQERFPNGPRLYQRLLGGGLFVLVFAPLNWHAANLIYPETQSHGFFTSFLIVLAITTCVYSVMSMLHFHIHKSVEDLAPETNALPESVPEPVLAPAPAQPGLQEGSCPFMNRLGPNSGTRLIRLAMNDHYIEAITETGQHLVYMRFADAIKELDPTLGTQVHRSHWVKFQEIEDIIKDGAKVSLKTSDGATVPVSRRRKTHLQEIGIL